MPQLARTFALQLMYNFARDFYANPQGQNHEVMSICCITKTMSGWNSQETVALCRERCGGMGYLSHSRFGEYLAHAHSACTAEGDNRVLMSKICKDMIVNVRAKKQKVPEPVQSVAALGALTDVTTINTLIDLLRFREKMLFMKLTTKIAVLTKQKMTKFNILFRHTSNEMQELAMAYGERHTIEACVRNIARLKNAANAETLTVISRLFATECVRRELGFYLINKVVSPEAAKNTNKVRGELINYMHANINELIPCLNIPGHAIYAPIAADWEEYYSRPNYGEVTNANGEVLAGAKL